jgi:hypothetical protein
MLSSNAQAMLASNAVSTSTDGRTDGLTKKVLTKRGDIALADAREKSTQNV